MGDLVGCLAMSHGPQLMLPPADWHLLNTRPWDPLPERADLQGMTLEQHQAKWNACMAAIQQLRGALDGLRADTVVYVGDDQHENFVDDVTPPFAVYMGDQVEASVSLRYLDQSFADNRTAYTVDSELSVHLVDDLMEAGFDPAWSKQTRYAGGLGHAFARPLKFLMPEAAQAIIPLMVNTYYPPAPSPKRCVQFGLALAEAIRRFPKDRRVALVASGGLSHTKIVEELDAGFLKALQRGDLDYMAAMPADELVGGTSEIRNWIVVAAGAGDRAFELVHYVPLYRTSNGVGCAMGFGRWG